MLAVTSTSPVLKIPELVGLRLIEIRLVETSRRRASFIVAETSRDFEEEVAEVGAEIKIERINIGKSARIIGFKFIVFAWVELICFI